MLHRGTRTSAADARTVWRQAARNEQWCAKGAGDAVGGARVSGSAGVEQQRMQVLARRGGVCGSGRHAPCWSASAGARRLDLRRRERHTGDACRGHAPGEVAEQDDDVQACVCGCGAGGALWNGLRELERGARGAGTRRHTYVEVSVRLSAMAQGWSSGLAVPRRGDSARTRTGKALEPCVRDVGDR
jgi:hypothetical protein